LERAHVANRLAIRGLCGHTPRKRNPVGFARRLKISHWLR
jgi:hypothetical protein